MWCHLQIFSRYFFFNYFAFLIFLCINPLVTLIYISFQMTVLYPCEVTQDFSFYHALLVILPCEHWLSVSLTSSLWFVGCLQNIPSTHPPQSPVLPSMPGKLLIRLFSSLTNSFKHHNFITIFCDYPFQYLKPPNIFLPP